MPLYDFQCTSCSHKDEVLRKISASNVTACPKCQQETFEKMVSAPTFRLNGTGWYETDFKGGKAPAKNAETPDVSTAKSAEPTS